MTRFTANALKNMLDTGTLGKLFIDAAGNRKPSKKDKLDYGSGRRSTHAIELEGAGTTKEHRLEG